VQTGRLSTRAAYGRPAWLVSLPFPQAPGLEINLPSLALDSGLRLCCKSQVCAAASISMIMMAFSTPPQIRGADSLLYVESRARKCGAWKMLRLVILFHAQATHDDSSKHYQTVSYSAPPPFPRLGTATSSMESNF
jgi:hypothetical protein